MESKRPNEYGEVAMKSPVVEKLENFWYYYKWHTIVALFLVFTILICSLQMCSKKETDVHVIYAGSAVIKRTADDGDTPAYNRLMTALGERAEDYNGDGEKILTLTTLSFLSAAEIEEINKNPELEVNYSLLEQDMDTFEQNFIYGTGDFYVLFCTKSVYEAYKTVADVEIFAPVASYLDPDYDGYELYSDSAVVLSSTPLWESSATIRQILPADTLVTLRVKSYISGTFDKAGTDQKYKNAEAYFRQLLEAK